MKAMKKTLAILLILVMCLSMLPTWALAEASAEASETDAALMSEEPAADVMQEPIPEEIPVFPPEEPLENAPEEAVLQEEIPEAEEQASEELVPEYGTVLEPDAVSDEGNGESGAAGNDASPAEDTSEIQPNAVANAEETGEAAAASVESPAEPETTEVPAAENPEAAEAVTVIFRIAPENAELVVYNKDNPENPEEKTEIEPEEDGSYLLLPGEYFYTLTAEGYLTVEEDPLLVVPSEEPVKVEAVMTPADEELTEEVTEEVMLQAEARPEETADLMANSGTCGDNLTWTLDDNGVLTIRGTGPMKNYSYSSSPWYSSQSVIKEILIASGVTSIGNYAFNSCSSVTNVTIPGSVTSIGDYAFNYCSKLSTVTVQEGTAGIGNHAFDYCNNLSSISLPASLTSIGEFAFPVNCPLEDVYYNGTNAQWSTVQIGGYNGSLIMANIHYTEVVSLSGTCGDALAWSLNTDGVLIISGNGPMASYRNYTSSSRRTVSASSAPWGSNASRIQSITLEEGVTTVGNAAFNGCNHLESITIPASMTAINSAFTCCSSLTDVYYNGTNSQWCGISISTSNSSLLEATIHYASVESLAGTCGDNLTWTLDDNGVLTISGNGAMYDYSGSQAAPWYTYRKSVRAVSIEPGVTRVGNNAFYNSTGMENITIPETVTDIGQYAFYGCSNLSAVAIPAGISSIEPYTFYGCISLTEVTVPEGVTSIGNSAFSCSYNSSAALSRVSLPATLASVGASAFYQCNALTDVDYNGSNADWSAVTIGSSNEKLLAAAFHFTTTTELSGTCGTNLTWTLGTDGTLTISGSGGMTEYYSDTPPWYPCCGLVRNLVIEDGVTSIGQNAFYGCSNLAHAEIPSSVTNLPSLGCLLGCSSLTSAGPIGSGCNIEFGWTTEIPDYAFSYSEITSVVFPEGVTSIGEEAFSYCPLASIVIPETVTSIGVIAFQGSGLGSVTVLSDADIPDGAFLQCESLREVKLEEGITLISGSAFAGCSALTDIELPDSLTSIGGSAFFGCSSLSRISIPASVTSIEMSAFDRCSALTDVYYDGTPEKWNSITVGSNNDPLMNATLHYGGYVASGTCGTGLSWILDRGGMLTVFGSGAMENYSEGSAPWYAHRDKIKTVVAEDGVTSIGTYAFANCSSLTAVTMPDSVKDFGSGAFYSCSQLESAVIPSMATAVNPYTFYGCNGLKTITIPANMTAIGERAFQGCTSLTSLTIPESVTAIGQSAFQDCTKMTLLTIPANVTTIGAQAFCNCSALTSATIPESMTELADGLFAGCSGLNQITIPTSVTNIGDACFNGCSGLKTVHYGGTQAQWDAIFVGTENEPLNSAVIRCALYGYGTCGDNLTWTLSRTGVLTIAGTGAMEAYGPDAPAPWDGLKDQIRTLEVGEGMTEIGTYAFKDCTSLSKCTLPTSLTTIGDHAFSGCTGMRDVTFGGTEAQWNAVTIGSDNDGLDRAEIACSDSHWLIASYYDGYVTWRLYNDWELVIVGDGKMQYPLNQISTMKRYAGNIERITIRSGITQVVESAFTGCTALTEIELAPTVTIIGQNAFKGCTALTEVIIPETITSVRYNAFADCTGITHVVMPASVTSFGSGVFDGCPQLKTAGPIGGNYNFEFGWTEEIPEKAFSQLRSLISVVLPDSVTSIGQDAFFECEKLPSITIPESVTSIGIYAFYSCDALYEFTLPSGLTEISGHLFSGCNGLTKIHIPGGVRSIGDMAFSACDALTDIYFDGTRGQWNSISTGHSNEPLSNATKHYAYVELRYSANGGENPPASQIVKPNTFVILPGNAPTREGYDLLGWADSATATVPQYPSGSGYVVNQDSTLYAIWQIGTFNVSYDANGGSGAPASQTKTWGETLTLAETAPTRTGYSFEGWATDSAATTAEYQPGGEYTSDADVTLYAVWQANTYTVHYDANGGDGAPEDQMKEYGTALTLSSARPSFRGYSFLGWATSAEATTAEYQPGGEYTSDASVTLYAVWKQITYTVHYDANGGSNAPEDQTKTWNEALTLSEAEPSREGYLFLGWSTEQGSTQAEYMPGDEYVQNQALALYAVWKIRTYTVRYNSNGGSGATAMQQKTYNIDLILSETEPTREGYDFVGWGDSAEAETPIYQPGDLYRENAGITLYAVWRIKTYTVRYEANGGYNAPALQTKTWGESLVLSSETPAKTDFLFMGWTTDPEISTVEYEPGEEYTREADMTLYAVWQPEAKSVEIWCYFTEEGRDENGNPTMVRNEACVNGQTFEGINMAEIPVWTQLFVKVLPEGAEQTVTWSTDPAENGTVNTDGEITFLKPGIVTVTATTTDGTEKSAWVSFEVVKTTKGESATGIAWELKENSDGSADLRLSLKEPEGTGTIDEAPWLEYAEEITSAEIPIGVTMIGDGAFNGCKSLETITIPSSVEEIGPDAFSGCEKLTTIEYIGTEAVWDSMDVADGNEPLTKDKLVYQSCEDLGLEHIHGEAVRENEVPATKETEGSYEEAVFCNVCRHELSRRTVVVPKLPVNYVLNKTELELTPGMTEQLRVKDGDTGTAITTQGLFIWSSSEETIATVENGKVTGVKPGTAVITVRTEDGHYEGKCFVQVEFQDVANEEAYFYEPVYWAVGEGITTGRSDTSFDPYGQCTRGHIVTFLWRAFGKQEPTISNPFTDVHEGDSFYKAVLWAYENGITTGQTATTFGPWNFCTRGQIVTFLWRAMGQTEPGIGNPFTDVNPGDGFYRAVLWAVENGITTGRTPTTFDPWATCTRGQAVTFLYRAMN